MNTTLEAITDHSFDENVLQAKEPVLVDFWAPWCRPCQALTPILEEVATQYGQRLKVYKMNISENEDIPQKLGIKGIPALYLYHDGELVGTRAGLLSKEQLVDFVDNCLHQA